MSADAVSGCISLVPNLVPLAAGVLAITLAYLNLERFRYGIIVSKLAAKALGRIEKRIASSASDSSVVKALHEYEGLQQLASLSSDFSAISGSPENGQTNLRRKPIFYRIIFISNVDRILCLISALFSSFILALGSAHAVGLCYLSDCAYLSPYFDDGDIAAPYWILLGGMFLPFVFVSLGSCIIVSGRRKTSKLEDNIDRIDNQRSAQIQEEARSARVNT